jgi:hypothetical protein
MVFAPCGADGSAGGGGSVEFGSMTGIGSGGSTLICDGAGFLLLSSATMIGNTSAMGA